MYLLHNKHYVMYVYDIKYHKMYFIMPFVNFVLNDILSIDYHNSCNYVLLYYHDYIRIVSTSNYELFHDLFTLPKHMRSTTALLFWLGYDVQSLSFYVVFCKTENEVCFIIATPRFPNSVLILVKKSLMKLYFII